MATVDERKTATKTATIVIPADYLEDIRSSLVAEIADGSNALAAEQAAVLSASAERVEDRAEDRDAALRWLRKDVDALDHLRGATGDVQLTADADTLLPMLEAMGKVLAGRLRGEFDYGPVDMGAVLEHTTRLRWCAEAATRFMAR